VPAVDVLGEPVSPELYSDRFRMLSREAGLRNLPPCSPHTRRGYGPSGVSPVGATPLLGLTVDVYISTYLRTLREGWSVGCQCSRSRPGRCPFHCLSEPFHSPTNPLPLVLNRRAGEI
jgi:hypothetical protein